MAAFEDGAQDDPRIRPEGPLAKLALLVEQDWWRATKDPDPRALEFVDLVKVVASQEQAIELRAARVLAWMTTKDLSGPTSCSTGSTVLPTRVFANGSSSCGASVARR